MTPTFLLGAFLAGLGFAQVAGWAGDLAVNILRGNVRPELGLGGQGEVEPAIIARPMSEG